MQNGRCWPHCKANGPTTPEAYHVCWNIKAGCNASPRILAQRAAPPTENMLKQKLWGKCSETDLTKDTMLPCLETALLLDRQAMKAHEL